MVMNLENVRYSTAENMCYLQTLQRMGSQPRGNRMRFVRA